MYSSCVTGALPPVGFPIRKSPGQSLFSGSPKLIAAYHVLHRLSLPRHPPYALSSLTIKKIKSINWANNYLPLRVILRKLIIDIVVKKSLSVYTYKSLYAIVKELDENQF